MASSRSRRSNGSRAESGRGLGVAVGAAFLAAKTGVPVVPVHLAGTGRILRKGRSVPRPSTTSVTFGRPLLPAEGENATRFAARIEREVAALADEATGDWYTARLRAHSGESPGLTGPESGQWRRAWALGDRRAKKRRRRWPDL